MPLWHAGALLAEVSTDATLGASGCAALGVEPGELRRVDMVATLLLGLEDELDLLGRFHAHRLPAGPRARDGRPNRERAEDVHSVRLAVALPGSAVVSGRHTVPPCFKRA